MGEEGSDKGCLTAIFELLDVTNRLTIMLNKMVDRPTAFHIVDRLTIHFLGGICIIYIIHRTRLTLY